MGEWSVVDEEQADSHLQQAAGMVVVATEPGLVSLFVLRRENHLQPAIPTSPRKAKEGTPHTRRRLMVVVRGKGTEPTLTAFSIFSQMSM